MIDRRSLPLIALRSFESAAEHLHLGKAGEELGVTHGAVSHQIRQLEDRLGVKLFSRAHNRLALTPAGQRLLLAVNDGFDRILRGTRYLDPENLSGPLVIACTQPTATSWAAKHICEFYKRYPTIDISVREIQSLQTDIPRDIDIAICYGAPDSDDRILTELCAPQLYPVCSPTLLQKHKKATKPADIVNFTLLHGAQVPWDTWLERYNVDPSLAKSQIDLPNISQALRAATLGYGVALSNTLETQEYIKDGQLVRLLDKPIEARRAYYLLSPSEENQTIKSQAFAEWIVKACEDKGGSKSKK